MTLPYKLTGWIAFALLACVATARADDAAPLSSEQMRADLKVAVLTLQVQSERQAEAAPDGGNARWLRLYLGQDASAQRVESLVITLDQEAPETLAIDGRDADALGADAGLHFLRKARLTPGPHQLRARLLLRAGVGKVTEETRSLELDYPFVGATDDLRLELRLQGPGLLRQPPTLSLRLWKPAGPPAGLLERAVQAVGIPEGDGLRRFERGSNDDPAVRRARLLQQTGRNEDALAELLSLTVAAPRTATEPPASYWLQTAAAYRMLGALDQARSLCDRLDTGKREPTLVAAERLQIADALFERGEIAEAEAQLLKARGRLSDYLAADWRFTYAQVLLAQDRTREAVAILGQDNAEHVDAYRYLNAPTDALRAAQYRRFNLAATLVRNGDETRGLSWLDLVGRLVSRDPELIALRDKANLALGWHFLNRKQGKTAVGALGRVGSEGLFSSPALLGMGWAQLAPAGTRLPRTKLVDTSVLGPESDPSLTAPVRNSLQRLRVLDPELHGAVGPRSFAQEDPPKDRREGLRRALKLWMLLDERDIHDPAIQEGSLAIAYAQDQLRNTESARAAYASAITRLSGLQQELNTSLEFLHQGRLIEAIDRAPDELAALTVLDQLRIQPGESAEALYRQISEYRTLGRLLTRLDGILAPVDVQTADKLSTEASDAAAVAVSASAPPDPLLMRQAAIIKDALSMRRDLDARALEARVQALVQAQGVKLDQYLVAARFSAARVEDRPAGDGPTEPAAVAPSGN